MNEIVQDVRERLIKIETLLEQKFVVTELKTNELDERIKKLEDSHIWMWRAIAGAIISTAMAFLLRK